MDGLRGLGEDVWFNLGDRDLAICLDRARRLAEGATLTEAIDELRLALGVAAPRAADVPTTGPHAGEGARPRTPFQEFMIRDRAEGPIEDVAFHGARRPSRRRRCSPRSPARAP